MANLKIARLAVWILHGVFEIWTLKKRTLIVYVTFLVHT